MSFIPISKLDSLRLRMERMEAVVEAARRLQDADCEWCEAECAHQEDERGQLHVALAALDQEQASVEGGSDLRWSGGDW